MKKLARLFILCCPSIIFAQNTGMSIEQKAFTCLPCHNQKGIGTRPAIPNLAGQYRSYLAKQLKDMQQGIAPHKTKKHLNLSEKDIDDLALYYAKMPLSYIPTTSKTFSLGEQLYKRGNFEKQIIACIACHGPTGRGNEQMGFPVLQGQHAAYLVSQLQAFKKGRRRNDLNQVMHRISSKMSTEDMKALAYYIEGLH